MRSTNVTRVPHLVPEQDRWRRQGHVGGVLWFTGLPASGKSTMVFGLESRLFELGYEVFAFDSARLRRGLNADLGFSREDRRENIRRAGELAGVMARSGLVVITGFISPYASDRQMARRASGPHFHEVYLDAPLATCEARDTRGRYTAARTGRLNDFIGIDAPYEAPDNPDLVVNTADTGIEDCLDILTEYARAHFALPK